MAMPTTPMPLRADNALSFTVHGVPVPKGSMRGFVTKGGHVGMSNDNKNTAPWAEAVARGAMAARGAQKPMEGPVHLACTFYMPRPQGLKRAVRDPQRKKADLDKLLRLVKDALTRAGVYRDDSQVCSGRQAKVFAGGYLDSSADGLPRVELDVYEYAAPEVRRHVWQAFARPLGRIGHVCQVCARRQTDKNAGGECRGPRP